MAPRRTGKAKPEADQHPLQGAVAMLDSPEEAEWIDARQGLRPQPMERIIFASRDGDVYFGYWDGTQWNADPGAYVGASGQVVAYIPLLDAIPEHPGWE